MRTIWKYTLSISDGPQYLYLPDGKLLCAQVQDGLVQLWFELDPSTEYVSRTFQVYGTGHQMPDDPGDYVGTVQTGPFVWHVYERKAV